MDIWFCSDPHYGHKNITKGESAWDTKQACRDFQTVDEMNSTLINNINKNVKKNDILYCLGDWSFGGLNNVFEFRKALTVENIHLVLGNHDHHIQNNKRIGDGPRTGDIFNSVQHYLNKKINGQNIVMSHYSMRTWDKAHHGNWMLYGHSHGTLEDYVAYEDETDIRFYKTMDVGFDTHPEFRPYHFDEIQVIMKDRVNLRVDHHNESTN